MIKIVNCPTCNKQVEWLKSSNYRPFCSDRCRLIDLGEWASDKHAIPGESIPNTENSSFLKDDEIE